MVWFDYIEEGDDLEGGVLELECRLELHVYRSAGDGAPVAVWLSDDALFSRRVEIGEA